MLGQSRRRWASVNPALVHCPVFAEMLFVAISRQKEVGSVCAPPFKRLQHYHMKYCTLGIINSLDQFTIRGLRFGTIEQSGVMHNNDEQHPGQLELEHSIDIYNIFHVLHNCITQKVTPILSCEKNVFNPFSAETDFRRQ